MIDGVPPYTRRHGTRAGDWAVVPNVNWGLATTSQEEAEGPYGDILDAIGDEFCTMPTSWGDEQIRINWEAIMAEEFAIVLRNWPQFTNLWLYNARIFVAEGLSFVFFPDDKDWRWLPYGLQHFKFPRRSRADINELDTICCKVDMLPYQLQQHVENEEIATEEGWNKQEVYEAIKTAAQHGLPSNDVEEWEKAWKNNDYYQGMTNLTVETVFCWARESDGTISHYIARYDSGGEFIYKKEGQKRDMESMMVAYQYGVGSNGDFHSIRGHAQKTYATSSAYNRLLNKALDMLVHVSTPHIKLTNEDTNNSMPLQPLGPYVGLEPGADFVEIKVPDFTQSLYPGLQLMQGLFQTKSRNFLPNPGSAQDKTERTKYEMQMKGEQEASLSTAGLNLFFDAWKRHLKQVVKRFIRQDYAESWCRQAGKYGNSGTDASSVGCPWRPSTTLTSTALK